MQICRTGFSLIELLIATVVLVTTVMGILMMFSQATVMVNQDHEIMLANNIVQERVEKLRSQSLSAVLLSAGAFTHPAFGPTNPILNNASGSIAVDYPFADNHIVRATVTVTWTMAGGRVMNATTATYITDFGINKH